MASIDTFNHIDPALRGSNLSSPPKPRDSQQHYHNPAPGAYSPLQPSLQPSPNNSYQSIQTPNYYPTTSHTQESPDDQSPSGNPNDPNDIKRPRACEACRQLKVKCEPDDNHPTGSCKRCAKANRQCIVTAPSRKRQKKTDSRVAELEKKIDALTATLAARGGAEPDVGADPTIPVSHPASQDARVHTFGGQWHQPPPPQPPQPPPPSSGNAHSPQQGVKRKITSDYEYFGGELHKSSAPSFKPPIGHANTYQPVLEHTTKADEPTSVDPIERGLIDITTARKCFDRYMAEMCEHLPIVVFPHGTHADEIRKNRPILFLAVLAVASGTVRPDLQPGLILEITRVLADKVIIRGEKSLELVQTIQVTTCFYQPPEKYEELNFNQLIHIAAVMALDLGMGKRSRRGGGSIWRPYHENKRPLSDPNSVEVRRCWLGCYYMCSNSSMSLRRPLLIRWSPYADECIDILTSSPDAHPSDKYFCHLVRGQHIAEDIGFQFSMDDPASPLSLTDPQTQYHLKTFERQLVEWQHATTQEMIKKPIIQHTEGILNLYMHEIAMHHNHNIDDFRPPYISTPIDGPPDPDNVTPAHIEALTTCINSAHSAFDAFLAMDVPALRALPTLFFVRNSYAAVALIKMYSAVSAKGSKFNIIFKNKDLKVEYYLDRMIEALSKACEGGMSRVAHKFTLIFNMLKSWHMKRIDSVNNGSGPVSRQRTPANGIINARAGNNLSQSQQPPNTYKAVPPQQDPTNLAWNSQHRGSVDGGVPQPHQQQQGPPRSGLQMLSEAAMGPAPGPGPVMPQPQPAPQQQWSHTIMNNPAQPNSMLPGINQMSAGYDQAAPMMPYMMPGPGGDMIPMDFTNDELMAFGFGDEFLAMNFGFETSGWPL
ncbi:hypothetical protein AYO20_05409 [Fonsecaea nubica]|uniref:Zn(2)-C6 fungal-type domain-containing protein n=1 Tax=Fonsecaea nubica TaxID=856822 RepID=A0A178CZT6_9EURO|nr:hypothetical protein AYO20_05409 [Fonsecaea nubica]OAL35358.1 hypothetical protein AYO20_05409 [Fonsecaea nubica]